MPYTDEERGIFRYHNGEKLVYGDPLRIDLAYREALKGSAETVHRDYNNEDPAINGPATLKLVDAVMVAFPMEPFDPDTGSGATGARCVEALWAWWAFLKKNEQRGVNSLTGSPLPIATPEPESSPTTSTSQ
jgi:hypothetical protein